jgi:hypothetical protein
MHTAPPLRNVVAAYDPASIIAAITSEVSFSQWAKAFSSEVEIGSREENASNPKS